MESKNSTIQKEVKPFLRWAGGKNWLIEHINSIMPSKINNYHEPFLGGASIFLSLRKYNEAYLSDINNDLILTYTQIKDNFEKVKEELNTYKNEKSFYYEIREKKFKASHKLAAQFIFLNKTSFNGIYRVNRKGEYNVPYGNRSYKTLFDFENLHLVSQKLQTAHLRTTDFMHTIENVGKGDLVFIDPPYTVMHGNNGFLKYNEKIFTWADQEILLQFINAIKRKRAFFIMTNAAHIETKKLFNSLGNPVVLERYSTVGGKGANRIPVNEYLFTNCI